MRCKYCNGEIIQKLYISGIGAYEFSCTRGCSVFYKENSNGTNNPTTAEVNRKLLEAFHQRLNTLDQVIMSIIQGQEYRGDYKPFKQIVDETVHELTEASRIPD